LGVSAGNTKKGDEGTPYGEKYVLGAESPAQKTEEKLRLQTCKVTSAEKKRGGEEGRNKKKRHGNLTIKEKGRDQKTMGTR